jgi:biotin carboxyl carrier protein
VVKYAVNVNGKVYEVEVQDLRTEPVRVIVNGKAFEVSVAEDSPSTLSRTAPRAEAAVELETEYVPTVASAYVETAAVLEQAPAAPPAPAPAAGGAAIQITAPMPGKILDIAVQVGSQVKHGDMLCNLEAMKMKSPIRSTVDGTVTQVSINEGQNVNFGAILFTLQ